MESYSQPVDNDLIGQRVQLKANVGSIRYFGKLQNNPKAGDDLWLGIEWDNEGQGRHNGTVEGVKYFECEFHRSDESGQSQNCSFIRYGKIQIGGQTLREAIIDKYRPEDIMNEEEKEKMKKLEEEEIYVNTDKKGMKKIEVVGQIQSYGWRSDPRQSYEITLELLKISELGPPGTIQELIPNTMYLYLDRNMLYDWKQYFQILRELPYLSTLTMTGNRLRKLKPGEHTGSHIFGVKVEELINPFLKELVLIDMDLDWEQINILAPTFVYIEQLHLVRNNCKTICSQYEISKNHFRNLKFINLEQNRIESWDELIGFRVLPVLKRLTVTKNYLRSVYYKHGFQDLYMVNIDDNLLNDWKAFDALNEFKQIKFVRCTGNPILEQNNPNNKLHMDGRQVVVAKLQFLKNLNGSQVEEAERRDSEMWYMKRAYEEFCKELNLQEKIEDLTDERVSKYMLENHPRWYELVETYGSPLDLVSLKQEIANIASSSARVALIAQAGPATGKQIEKKLLLSMTVGNLKAMCAKLFKIEVLKQKLSYHDYGEDIQGGVIEYDLEDDLRQLSFYCVRDNGQIWIQSK